MYADRGEAGAKRSVHERLNGASVEDSGRRRQFTGKRDVKMEESLNQNRSSGEKEQGSTTTRIFVGGLGENVTSDDISWTLSSLGMVKLVDIVRTKRRSFAYVDFLPSSAKSLSKLFSMYNGCLWKGGRLKLEKAKEHYLVRLRREWAEDSEHAVSQPSNGLDVSKNIVSSNKPKKIMNQERPQLQIFFPKLRKIKSLPFDGTGKHKYSFQRIEVPSLPTHFCDCEEHSGIPHTAPKQYFNDPEPQSGGMNEEELNMMNSVMNKIFERETDLNVAYHVNKLIEEAHNSLKSASEQLVDDSESNHAEDEDNLVINMFARQHRMVLLQSQEQEVIAMSQKSRFSNSHTSAVEPAQTTLPSTKKRKSVHIEESDGNEFLFASRGKKQSLQTSAQTSELRPVPLKATANRSWSHNYSWKELVGGKGKDNSPFVISDMLLGGASREQGQAKSDGLNVPDIVDSKKKNLVYLVNLEAQSRNLDEPEGIAEAMPPILDMVDYKKKNLVSHENLEAQCRKLDEPEEIVEAKRPIPDVVVKNSSRGASWLQKCSWTQLVNEGGGGSFSLSQILPGIPSEKQEVPKFSDADVAVSHDQAKQSTSESLRDGNGRLVIGKGFIKPPSSCDLVALDEEPNFAGEDIKKSITPGKDLHMMGDDELSAQMLKKKPHKDMGKTSIKDIKIGETCSFMRTAASVKEWSKTKAALSGSRKKKDGSEGGGINS